RAAHLPRACGSTRTASLDAEHFAHQPSSTRAAVGVPRDNHGRIKRSETARRDFEHHHPCPSTGKTSGACAGYAIDHFVPLKRGGADGPSNMQWKTIWATPGYAELGITRASPIDAAKEKDRWE